MRRMKGPAPRRARRGRVSTFLHRFGVWVGVPSLLAGGLYAAVELSRSPLGQSMLQYGADRMLDGTARLGLVVTDIKVEGRETTDRDTIIAALGACEIVPRGSFYDYTAKYAVGGSDHLTPAPVPPSVYEEALDIGLRAHRALGCRGVSRADLRYDDTPGGCGRLYLLEVNTQPGMTPTSLVPDIARHVGIGFDELVAWMVENASCDG